MSEGQAGQLANSGWAFYLAGNRQGALRDFRAALAIDPDHVNALSGLIQTHMALNQLPAADEAAMRLLKIAPDLAQAHRMQGEVLRRRRRLAGAEEHVRTAIRMSRSAITIWRSSSSSKSSIAARSPPLRKGAGWRRGMPCWRRRRR